eukprot:GEMP01062587.1.p3 GENE.GEMP01062587.1~~GEMP01062587.1.p3  ORF type:complete len:121 (+),score=37.46 GEMP01062587.1:804-1166(+)
MAILFLVAEKLEAPSIIDELLDIDNCPRKPIYELADPSGLVLYDCVFEGLHFDEPPPAVASQPLHAKRLELQRLQAVLTCLAGPALETPPAKKYTPLRKRAGCPTLEEKQQLMEKKKKTV